MAFLYTNGKHTKIEVKGMTPFIMASKLSWNKSEEVKDMYNENFKALKKNKRNWIRY